MAQHGRAAARVLRTSSVLVQLQAAQAGLGLAMLPCWQAAEVPPSPPRRSLGERVGERGRAPDLQAHARVVNLAEPAGLARALPRSADVRHELWLAVHADLQHTARVRAVIAFLVAEAKAREGWLAGRRRAR